MDVSWNFYQHWLFQELSHLKFIIVISWEQENKLKIFFYREICEAILFRSLLTTIRMRNILGDSNVNCIVNLVAQTKTKSQENDTKTNA